ncbi:MAG: Flp pilus assembly protein CpaB [Myxococcaceae bacterium]
MLKGKTPLLVALILAVLAAVVSASAVAKAKADVRKGWNLVPIIVAQRDVPEGTVLTTDMISQRAVPEQFVTSSVVKPDSASYVIDQKILVPLQTGDPLLWSQFETTKALERLSTKVQKRTRAITIEANKSHAVGGWVRPNDRVDIIGTFRDPTSQDQMAVTLLENIVVLATGKMTGTTNFNLVPESQRTYSDVTLLVIPEEAEVLALATELGTLSLSLRNPDDEESQSGRQKVTAAGIFDLERNKQLERRRAQTIDVIRGQSPVTTQPAQ